MDSNPNKYRATRLWNDIIRAFRNGMPVGRHRRYMKLYENCFISCEGVTWVHDYLRGNPNFGGDVTREQTILLLQKLQKAGVVEDVRGPKYNKDAFADSSRLFRFTVRTNSPAKPVAPAPARKPLSNINTNVAPTSQPLKPVKLAMDPVKVQGAPLVEHKVRVQGRKAHRPDPPIRMLRSEPAINKVGLCEVQRNHNGGLSELHRRGFSGCRLAAQVQLTKQETEHVYQTLTLDSLKKVLDSDHLDHILDVHHINISHVVHNMMRSNREGQVTNIPQNDKFSSWVTAAMKWLMGWPDSVRDSGRPHYPGFERDVYQQVLAYFKEQKDPLLSYQMYHIFMNVLACIERKHQVYHTPPSNDILEGMTSYHSVESLLMNLTANAPNSPFKTMNAHPKSSHGSHVNSPAHAWLETSFSVDNKAPETTYRYQMGPPDYLLKQYQRRCMTSQERAQLLAKVSSMDDVNVRDVMPQRPMRPHKRCYSMNNVHEVDPVPENNLPRKTLLDSQSTLTSDDQAPCNYGYSVALTSKTRRCQTLDRKHRFTDSAELGAMNRTDTFSDLQECGLFGNEDDDDVIPPPRPPPPYIAPPDYRDTVSNSGRQSRSSSRRSLECQSPGSGSDQFNPERYHQLDVTLTPGLDRAFVTEESTRPSRTRTRRSTVTCSREAAERVSPQEFDRTVRSNRSYRELPRDSSYLRAINRQPHSPIPGVLRPPAHFTPPVLELPPLGKTKLREALQLVSLLLPPGGRKKLQYILLFLSTLSEHPHLQLSHDCSNKETVISDFTSCLLGSESSRSPDMYSAKRLVGFLIEMHGDIMKIPETLKLQIEERLSFMRRSKMLSSQGDSSGLIYCRQVSLEQYEQQKMSNSQVALHELLETIVKNRRMASKEKKKKLKKFKETHPDIYMKRFPTSASEAELFPDKPKIKQPLLKKPLQRLKSIRL